CFAREQAISAVVALGDLGAVAHEIFDETARGIEESADAYQASRTPDDFASDNFTVTAAKGMNHAALRDGRPDDRAECFQCRGILRTGFLQEPRGGLEVSGGKGRHT